MIKALIQYIGNRKGLLANFYSIPKTLGTYESEEDVSKAFQKWLTIVPVKDDWKLTIE